MFLLPRNKASIPIIIMACFIPSGQRLVIAGLDFDFLRILVLTGWMRFLIKGEHKSLKINKLDILLILFSVINVLTYTISYMQLSSIIYRLGTVFDTIGMYFLFRVLFRKKEDIFEAIKAFLYISLPIFLFFVFERITGRNVFSVFGGVPEFTMIREGRFRCQGAFAHPILAGCFWASLLPFFISEIYQKRIKKMILYGGIFCSISIVILSASSTPVLSMIFALIGAFFILFRNKMSSIRLLIVLGILLLDIIMEAPVYHLISRIDISGGSTGWHRFHLIEQALVHWKDWFFLGVQSITSWNVWKNDITNQYILEAVNGGFFSLLIFLLIIVQSFGYIGNLWRKYNYNKPEVIYYWSVGVSLFMHITNFIAVSYFGQIVVLWYFTLSIIGSLYQSEAIKKNSLITNSTNNMPGTIERGYE